MSHSLPTARPLLRDRGLLTAMALAVAVNLGPALVFPILPLYAQSLGANYSQAGLLVGSFYFGRLACDLVAGLVVGRFGEKASAIAGLCVLAAGALLAGVERSFLLVVLSWAVAGVGSAIAVAAMFSYLLKSVPAERVGSALSLFYGAFSLALIAGGFSGGVIASGLGLPTPFLFLTALAVLAALFALRFVRPIGTRLLERTAPELRDSHVGSVRIVQRALRDHQVLTPTMVVFAELWLVGGAFNTILPLFARNVLKASTLEVATLFALVLVAEFVTLFPAGKLIDSRGSRFVLIPSLAAIAALSVLIGMATTAALFVVLLTLLGLASGLSSVPPVAILSNSARTGHLNAGVGVFRFGADLGLMLGPLVAGFTASRGFGAAFAICGVPAFLVLLFLIVRNPARGSVAHLPRD